MLFSFSDRSLHKTVPSLGTSIERSLLMIILKILGEMARTPCTKYARYSLNSSGLLLVICIQHHQQCECWLRRRGMCCYCLSRGKPLAPGSGCSPYQLLGCFWLFTQETKALLDSSALKCLVQRLHIIPDLSAWIKLDKLSNWRWICTSIKVIKP